MRDHARRQRILRLIEMIWTAPGNEDLRLFQLLGNAARMDRDPYYYEDFRLEADLEAEVERLGLTLAD